jgi:hypothetical protein
MIKKGKSKKYSYDCLSSGSLIPGNKPEKYKQRHGNDGGDNLILGNGRHKYAAGDKCAAQEQRPQINRNKMGGINLPGKNKMQNYGIGEAHCQHKNEDYHAGCELPHHDIHVSQRVRKEKFDRPRLLFFSEKPHGQNGDYKKQNEPYIIEEILPHPQLDVAHSHQDKIHEIGVEKIA